MRVRRLFARGICLFVTVFLLYVFYIYHGGPSCYFCHTSEQIPFQKDHPKSATYSGHNTLALSLLTPILVDGIPQTDTYVRPVSKFRSSWWRNHTETVCRTLGMNTNLSMVRVYDFEKILVDDGHKLLYCHIAKVASTNLGKIFAILSGLFNGTNPNLIPSSEVHLKYNSLHVHLSSVPVTEISYKVQNYYKFIYVRDPFERLLSAFRNKFIKPPSSYFSNLSNKLVKVYRTNSTVKTEVTFEEFIRYLVDPKRKVPTNPHWQPFYELCRPCEVKYDFVGKLSTFYEDTRHILEINNLTSIVDFPKIPDTSHSLHGTDLLLNKYYSAISKDLLLELYKIYYPDYAIFDLDVPSSVKQIMAG